MTVGQKIYELRTARNLSQGDLAEKLDVSRQSVSKWETDAAIPDLDKLMKLCDLFGVTLDELVGREREEAKQTMPVTPSVQTNVPPVPNTAFTTQKIVGYILLAVSLLGGILLAIFVYPSIAVTVALPILICAIICLAVKRRAGYWCMWVVWFILELFRNFLVARTITVAGVIDIVSFVFGVALYVILFIITLRVFKGELLPAQKQKGIWLVIAWVIYLILSVLPELAWYITVRRNMFSMMVVNILPSAVLMIATPFLFVYTARYLNSRKHNPK